MWRVEVPAAANSRRHKNYCRGEKYAVVPEIIAERSIRFLSELGAAKSPGRERISWLLSYRREPKCLFQLIRT